MQSNSKRGLNFSIFAEKVLNHIENYAVPQYGDEGTDQVTNYTSEECFKQAEKYLSRRKSQQRADQKYLDPMKAVHYIQMGVEKLEKEKS